MFSAKNNFILAVGVSAIVFSTCTSEQKPVVVASDTTSNSWAPVNEDDWAVYKDVPNYHFSRAKEYLQSGDYAKASAELKLGNSFLLFQNYRLSAASKHIEELSNSIATENNSAAKDKEVKKLDDATSAALKVINNQYAMVPVEAHFNSVFEESFLYHFDKAKSNMIGKDRLGAASEIRRAGSFLKLIAARSGNTAKAQLDTIGNELKELALKVESGTIKGTKELDSIYQKADNIDSKKKE
jgi:hypothetical protein